jgi:hypothetical protein
LYRPEHWTNNQENTTLEIMPVESHAHTGFGRVRIEATCSVKVTKGGVGVIRLDKKKQTEIQEGEEKTVYEGEILFWTCDCKYNTETS